MAVIASLTSEVFSLGCIISSTCKEYLATDNKSDTVSVLVFSSLLYCIGTVYKMIIKVNEYGGKKPDYFTSQKGQINEKNN